MPPIRSYTQRATMVLLMWFAFLNTQFLLGIAALFLWRATFPKLGISEAIYWDHALAAHPAGMVLLALLVANWVIGVGLPTGISREGASTLPPSLASSQPPPELPITRFVIKYVLLEIPGIVGFAVGMLRGNPMLAVPFIAASTLGFAFLWPAVTNLRLAPPGPR